jgi:hypothetical protein
MPSTSVDAQIFELEIAAIVKSRGWNLAPPVWEKPHLSTKAGPNCQAMVGAVLEAHAMPKSLYENIKILAGSELTKMIDANRTLPLSKYLLEFAPKLVGKTILMSKLSKILDKEAKCRIIAIVDYWSQSALFPLHNLVFKILLRIRNDCTFDQARFRSILPQQGPYFSYDLSAATDRFPVLFQKLVVKHVTGSLEYADAWLEVLTNREFYVPWTGDTVKYSCGQPMGAYSSWGVFTLSHHIVVAIAARRVNVDPSRCYALLGDDIVIANEAVAKEYALILASLGVSISETKSHVSVDTYEFAKRWIHKGQEVTGAPLTLYVQNIIKPKWFDICEALRQVECRWLPCIYTLVSPALLICVFQCYGISPGLSSRLAKKSMLFLQFPLKGDPIGRVTEKCIYLSGIFFPGLLGCSNLTKSKALIWSLLAFAKTALVAQAMKKSVKEANKVIIRLMKFLESSELDSQSILFLLVVPAVAKNHVLNLQQAYEKLRGFMHSGRGRPISLSTDYYQLTLLPEDLMSARRERLSIYTSISILHKGAKISSAIMLDRSNAALDSNDDTQYGWKNFSRVLGA